MMSTAAAPIHTMVTTLLNNFVEGVTVLSVTQEAVKVLPILKHYHHFSHATVHRDSWPVFLIVSFVGMAR